MARRANFPAVNLRPYAAYESRILQASIFNTSQSNPGKVDFDTVLLDVMNIADEVDSQLKQAVLGFMEFPGAIPTSLPA